ncbi:MAG: HU family DNA-binding protein [Muribaculaceae bacterium]|nr:HU family DNA-binding protein [Muribaculaceae bacterium]MDE6575538.1 HU family DNA-binding protein [Muribaculaceae bacterium]
MDYKQFRKRIAELTGRSTADVDALVEGLSVALRQSGSELDSVAVPTFGTFVPEKHDEEIRTDLSTGRKMLLPPEISVKFVPAGALAKRLTPPQEMI